MSEVKLFLFDFDGVVADTGADIADAVRATQLHFGVAPMPQEQILSYVGFGAAHLIRCSLTEVERPEALSYFRTFYQEHAVVKTRLFPGILEALERIRMAGAVSCIVSNKPEAITREIVQTLGVQNFFTIVQGPESLTHMKPDPEGLFLCMHETGYAPSETVMIGDSYTDIQAGRAAGALTCGVLYGIGDRTKLLAEHADYYVENVLQLLDELHI